MSQNIKTIPTGEYDAVVAVAQQYVDGLREGSAKSVSLAFHDDAVMYGHSSPTSMMAGTIRNLYTFIDEKGAAPQIKTRIDLLAITPSTAVVRIDMEKDAAAADYTDFLTIIKINGKWQTIAKTFHMYGI